MDRYTPRGQRGQVLVLTAMALVAMLAATGLVIDIGLAYLEKARLQSAADAAVLAGGRELPNTSSATTQATKYIKNNRERPADATISYAGGNTKITVAMTKKVPTLFMRVVGVTTVKVTAKATGMLASVGGPFDYAIFSGSKTVALNITGGGWTAKGSIHTNNNLTLTGGGFRVTGAAEAMQKVTVTGGGVQIGSIVNNASFVDMPDYSASIAAAAATSGQVYNSDKTITSGGFTIGNTIYVKGKTTITGGGFNSTGAILSDGDMTITGGGITIAGSNQVCFYSKNGNITFTGGGAAFNGVLYAPNGRITITGGGVSFNGCIVAKEVVLTGGGINVNRSDYPVKSIPSTHVKLVE